MAIPSAAKACLLLSMLFEMQATRIDHKRLSFFRDDLEDKHLNAAKELADDMDIEEYDESSDDVDIIEQRSQQESDISCHCEQGDIECTNCFF
eukprot:CAMPEP_0169109250 /NCGR_PEP_ID=MMETSP1015-20121227/25866_1 /TAXON_ID=342587 /ORGANISM="Karlodinium micrum, Strain CCMP2283" /LENGTH=92 /DNA_ID=CAMNT_0009170937 /DNA_START=54 /DNA_END=332 /DNA_ORIENTATION=-